MNELSKYVTPQRLVTVIIFLISIAIVVIAGESIFSPGDLSTQSSQRKLGGVSSHADLNDRCSTCHSPLWGKETMADLCLDCHTEIIAELQEPNTIHRKAVPLDGPKNCKDGCHTEHKGATASLTIISTKHFAYPGRNYSLQGHQKKDNGDVFACTDCHQGGLNKFDLNTCSDCHNKRDKSFMLSHVDTFGSDCLKCHDGIDTYGSAFNHQKGKFSLDGKHATISCGDCHQGARTLEALQGTASSCYSCHRQNDKHQGTMGTDCAKCHNTTGWKQVTVSHTSFALTSRHTAVACASCHVNGVYKGTASSCYSCHRQNDKHQGTMGTDCAKCHNTTGWKQVTVSHTSFALTGRHTAVACASCHVNGVYKGTASSCYSCHRQNDKHQGTMGTDCAKCHNTTGWKQVTVSHTSFALTGRHTAVACASCHVNGVYKGTASSCYSCHRQNDKHQGTMGTDCAKCHNTTGWSQVTFSHRFPRQHGGASTCQTCHPVSQQTYSCYDGCHKHTLTEITNEHREVKTSNLQNCVSCHPNGR